jgi:hypothetical protein
MFKIATSSHRANREEEPRKERLLEFRGAEAASLRKISDVANSMVVRPAGDTFQVKGSSYP